MDSGTSRGLKFRSSTVKVPEPVKAQWVDGILNATVSIETLDATAAEFDVNAGHADWQVLIKVNPE